MARGVGSKKVILASCAPPIRHSNVYGIDMPSRHELVAHQRTIPEIAKEIGADLVIYQTLADLVASVQGLNPAIKTFDCSVFTGEYVTGGVDEAYLSGLEETRADKVKTSSPSVNGRQVSDTQTKPVGIKELPLGSSGPMSAADDTIGLHNSWKL